jgi:SIR2-like domain
VSALTHDLLSVANELSAKLATRSRHVCVLLGAGAGVGAGLPDLARLTNKVVETFSGDDAKLIELLLKGRNLEEAITRLRRIAALVDNDEQIGGFSKEVAVRLDRDICQAIIAAIRTPENLEDFYRLGSWASRADYRSPIEIFTPNYDLLIETGLEYRGASYFDGFVGHLRGYFRPDLVEGSDTTSGHLPASFVRLWKLHGSSNWVWMTQDGVRRVVRLGDHATGTTDAVAVFPSDDKYDDSRRVPFVVLMDRFRRALAEPETLLLVCGFAFGDQHLNEIVFEAARRRPRSEFVALCYSTIPEALKSVARETKNITVLSADEGIIGGVVAPWGDVRDLLGVAKDNRCCLGDFACFAAFLDRQNQPEEPVP